MNHTIWVLTLMAVPGGSDGTPVQYLPSYAPTSRVAASQQPAPVMYQQGPVSADAGAGSRGLGLRDRVRRIFQRDREPAERPPMVSQPGPLTAQPPYVVIQEQPPAASQPPAAAQAPATHIVFVEGRELILAKPLPMPPPASEVSGEIKKEYRDRVKRSDDYTTLTGQLFYVHADGGLWVLRYAPLDKEDRYGGSVVLASAVSMRHFREGDLVTVRGEIIKEGRASKSLGGPLFRAVSVEMVERSDP